jgi:hypothetical protein
MCNKIQQRHIHLCTYGNMQDAVEIIEVGRKGRHTNNTKKHHIFCTQKQKKQMNEVLSDLNSPVYEAVYNHCITQ